VVAERRARRVKRAGVEVSGMMVIYLLLGEVRDC